MAYEPDYSKYKSDELLDANRNINREKYPQTAQNLDNEIVLRHQAALQGNNAPGAKSFDETFWQNQQVPASPKMMKLEFRGQAREYFRIWIVNLCLTIITLGIFSAWAKVRKKRYIYSHTILDNSPFQYLGQPIPILKGRVVAAIAFLLYYASSHFFTFLLPYVLGVGLIAAPWLIVRSAAFNARYSAFRNMTFHFDGTYLTALKAFFPWFIIPIIFLFLFLDWNGKLIVLGIVAAIFSFMIPWLIKQYKRFIIEHTSFGGRNGAFSATGGQFYKMYLVTGLIMIAVTIPSAALAGVFAMFAKKMMFAGYLAIILIYAGYVVAYAYLQARSSNIVWNNTQLGPLRFQSSLHAMGLLKLYVTNALGIIFSIGLLTPWAIMRSMKYRADNMHVLQEGELTEFQGSDMSSVAAVGAETLDFFDMDLSL